MQLLPSYMSPGPSGTWRAILSDGKLTAKVTCPLCRFQATLAGSHEIAADGAVTPSLVCGNDKCDFHESVVLRDWSPLEAAP